MGTDIGKNVEYKEILYDVVKSTLLLKTWNVKKNIESLSCLLLAFANNFLFVVLNFYDVLGKR